MMSTTGVFNAAIGVFTRYEVDGQVGFTVLCECDVMLLLGNDTVECFSLVQLLISTYFALWSVAVFNSSIVVCHGLTWNNGSHDNELSNKTSLASYQPTKLIIW